MNNTKFETFHQSHERIFGRKSIGQRTFTQMASSDDNPTSNTQRKVNKKKQLCPHCATMNLRQMDSWNAKCTNCGYTA